MDVELSIIMPCLNEAETLATCIRKAQDFLAQSEIVGEVVIGDNGSTDGSQDIAKQLGAVVVDVPIRGYGAALYGAVAHSRGRYCIMGDSDDSYDFSRLGPFVEALRAGADLVMGNRFRGASCEAPCLGRIVISATPFFRALGVCFLIVRWATSIAACEVFQGLPSSA